MNTRLRKIKKHSNLGFSYLSAFFHKTPPFVRIIPSDKCNLNCSYCWQRKVDSYDMSLEEFFQILKKMKRLRVGLITFLGGEPMMWPHLYEALTAASQANLLSDMTTNGTLLNQKTIQQLAQAGLDYLNISVDVQNPNKISHKNSILQNNLIDELKEVKKEHGMHFRFNSVIAKGNFEETKMLIEYAQEHNVQLSLGYIVPPIDKSLISDPDIYFHNSDENELNEIITHILSKKRKGYPIIDPDAYFENIFRFLKQEKFWDCNYPSRYGWINVTPRGRIRSCTKKMDELDIHFTDLDESTYLQLRSTFRENVKECNTKCYSNCAFDSHYYTKNKKEMLGKILARLKYH